MIPKENFKIYILGFIPKRISSVIYRKYINAQIELEKFGYTVYNPIMLYLDENSKREEVYRKNLKELLSSDAIYLIFDSNQIMKNSEELKIALKSDKFIFHQSIEIKDVDPAEQNIKETKARLRRHSKKYIS